MQKYLCIHGHFYQPPRENPWLEEVEQQDSAYPYHDWNERITAECYAPNAVSRMLDGEGRIVNIVNNYAAISFNFGPTLLSWLQQKNPLVYRAILEADRKGQQLFSGHGTAIAQAYNHIILPLANDRDKYTQILWGIRDFECRFGRKPEGLWLPETAVDLKSLTYMEELGIKYTILSPYQAGKVRPKGTEHWQDVTHGRIDPTTAYLQQLPSGRHITLFFYDGPIARAVAFEKLLIKGEHLANRLLDAFSDQRPWPQLVHIATDGESYGHHHPHGDMALAYALHQIDKNPGVRPTIYGEFLEKHPPEHEVKIVENTAWSCSHGVERWRSNCGCNSGRSGWNQNWRGPLREALDWLRDSVTPLFEEKGGQLLRDPWAARNDYIQVILNRSPESIQRFLMDHAARELEPGDEVTILKLMELQRQAMLMYTSCGWFFDELSGIETVQIIEYAGRLVQLARDLFGKNLEGPFLDRLEKAKSNLPEHRDGRHIYEKWVKPAVVGWEQIGAHYAINSLFEDYPDTAKVYCYTAERTDYHSSTAGKARLVVGRAIVNSEISHETQELSFGVLHFGDHNVNGGVRIYQNEEEYSSLLGELKKAFDRVDFPQILRLLDKGFGESTYSLKSLFRDEQRRVLQQLLQSRITETEEMYRRMYEEHLPMMRFLAEIGVPLPPALRTAMVFVVGMDLRLAFSAEEPNLDHIQQLLEEALRWKIPLDAQGLAFQFKKTLALIADRFRSQPQELDHLLNLEKAVDLAAGVPFEVDLWHPQNVFFILMQTIYPELESRAQGDETTQTWLEHFVALGDKLGIQVSGIKKKIAELQKAPTVPRLLEELFTRTRLPWATYRFQFNKNFTFQDALSLIPYLHDLGISDAYASPLLQATPNSPHGYDICDHSQLNPELGSSEDFDALTAALNKAGMGLILDTVPNHMGISHESNHWWMDVLENGPSSIFANHFDIDWHPVNQALTNKVLLPVLEDQYGTVLEAGKIKLCYQEGAFYFAYYDRRFPVSPCTYAAILEHKLEELTEQLGEDDEHLKELKSIVTAVGYLPSRNETTPDLMAERNREKEIIKRRIAAVMQNGPGIQRAVEETLSAFNGRGGEVTSFDQLDALLAVQVFRPAFWRVATEEINYRRFFDINELAAIRVEEPEVFHAAHHLFFDLLAEGKATGLRIDHPDGLWNPTQYFRQLQKTFVLERLRKRVGTDRSPEDLPEQVETRLDEQFNGASTPSWPLYVVAEKILAESEPLPRDWAVHGTTGYDALNSINGLFVDTSQAANFEEIYARFLGEKNDYGVVVQASKRMIMLVSLASEINALGHRLDRISERNRRYRDFTLNSLTFAMREIIAFLPVYRTYITDPATLLLRDRMYLEAAVEEAKRRNPRTAGAIFDFIRDTLLLRNLSDFREEDQPLLVDWAMKFQQLTGPIMAKGVEDTSFYIYNRLVSLNEVGGHPDHFGVTLHQFHHHNEDRVRRWPHSMLASSTHDTKRSEDVRARINVLSELPQEWEAAVRRWSEMNEEKKRLAGKRPAPSRNDEYLLYQTLVGSWPAELPELHNRQEIINPLLASYRTRIEEYMQKATKEAKAHTSWINPNAEYDNAVRDFVRRILPDDPTDPFLKDLLAFQRRIGFFGYFNALSQLLLKLACPGVPDLYQGTELWDFSLVDPDNRRPVDYQHRKAVLANLRQRSQREKDPLALLRELMANLPDGRVKLFTIYRTLSFRREFRRLFSYSNYRPCLAVGARGENVCAFTRDLEEQELLIAVPRLIVRLTRGLTQAPLGEEIWHNTLVLLPEEDRGKAFRNIFTGQTIRVGDHSGRPAVAAADLFAHFPVFLGKRIAK